MRSSILARSCAGITKVLLPALLGVSIVSHAAIFEHTPPQQLVAGETLRVVLRLSSESTQQTDVSIVSPKVNMTLTRMTRDKYLLRWDSPESLPAEQLITVQASISGTQARVEKHHIIVRSKQVRQSGDVLPETTAPGKHSSLPEPDRHTKPIIKGISTQIISAGQTVRFKVFAPIENGGHADISVDQLPPDARIQNDRNDVPTFIWETASTDRGEHRLLFTATHPSKADLQDTAEAIVIIEYSNASGASDMAASRDTSEELASPEETLESETGITSQNEDEMATDGAEIFTDPYQPPNDYPTDTPSDYPTDAPSEYPTDTSSEYPTDAPPEYPTDTPPDYPTDSPPGSFTDTDGPDDEWTAGSSTGPEPGMSSPPPGSQ